MPFTASHMAAVLPLVGRRLDATCLLVGAMAPDLEYVVRGEMSGGYGHTLGGLLGWCLPITLLVALVLHRLMLRPLVWMAPRAWQSRLVPTVSLAWPGQPTSRAWLVAAISALVGAITHLTWDGITHSNGWIVRRVPGMDATLTLPAIGDYPLPRLLQHTSTVVGLLVLAVWLRRRQWPTPQVMPAPMLGRSRWLLIALVALGVALYVTAAIARTGAGLPSIGDVVISIMAGTALGSLVTCLLVGRRARAWRDAR